MRYTRNADVVHRSAAPVVVLTLVAFFWVVGAIAAVVNRDEQAPLFVVIGLTILPLVTFGNLRPRVVLRGEEVVIYGMFTSQAVRYEAINEVRESRELFGYRSLEIQHSDSWTTTNLPYIMAGPAFLTGWQRKLATEITERAAEARSSDGPQAPNN